MIRVDDYKILINRFCNIDLNSSLVTFCKKKVDLGGTIRTVTLPEVKGKPCAFFRLIQQIVDFIFGKSRYLHTAQQLESSIRDAIRVLPEIDLDSELFKRIIETSTKIIGKLSAAVPSYKSVLDRADRQIKNIAHSSGFLKIICEECSGYELQRPGSFEIAYAMDWEKDDPVLFDCTYVNELLSSAQNQRTEQLHSDLRNPYIHDLDRNKFFRFLRDLMNDFVIKDRHGNPFSVENVNRLRQMTLAILNELNSRRAEEGFHQLYASVVLQICSALQNCTNGINTNIENIFTNLVFPKGGTLGFRIKLVLQSMRDRAFRAAILHCIKTSSMSRYYLTHEASSVNYYFSRLTQMVGLPVSVSNQDNGFHGYALKGADEQLLAHFNKNYTPERIVQVIWETIHDYNDSAIPTRLFTEWVESKYPVEKDRYEQLDDEGRYKVAVVVQCLLDLEILKSKT